MKKLSFFIILTFTLIIVSSCTKEGCTNPFANNFSSEAEKDNGSCQFDSDAMTGSYLINGTINCGVGGVGNLTNEFCNVYNSPSARHKVIMYLPGVALTITVNESSLIVDNQTIDGYVYQGTGILNGNDLTLNISAYYLSTGESCNYNLTGVRQ
jgi:hypothetical protein